MSRRSAPSADLDQVLSWLDENSERAAAAYLDLRRGLMKIFAWNHCSDPEGLTDEVFDRVARKLPGLMDSYQGNPALYFYAVANNLIKEYRKTARSYVSLDGVDRASDDSIADEEETRKTMSDCLDKCLRELSAEKRDLILSYYSKERQEKLLHRAQMARRLGVPIGTLRVRMLRIRTRLEECIEHCLDGKIRNK